MSEPPVNLTDRLEGMRDALAGGPIPGTLAQLAVQLAALAGGPIPGTLAQLEGAVTRLRGEGVLSDMADLANILQSIQGGEGTSLYTLLSELAAARYLIEQLYTQFDAGAGLSVYALIDGIYTVLHSINIAIGGAPNDSLESTSVRGLLARLIRDSQYKGIPADGVISEESGATITIDGMRCIVWPDIAGLTESDGNTKLTPDNSWDGWQAYIQSDAPDCSIGLETTRPTNSWFDLVDRGAATLSFCVESGYTARGYLRYTEPELQTLFSSVLGNYVYNGNIVPEHQIQWPQDLDPLSTRGGYARVRGYRPGNFSGWRFRCTIGDCSIDGWNGDNYVGQAAVGSSQMTWLSATTHINIRGSAPFTIEVLPPLGG